MQFPTVGRMVHYFPAEDDRDARANGNSGPLAAVITRVWGEYMVNLTVFPDFHPPICRTSIGRKDSPGGGGTSTWDWPEIIQPH